MSSNRNSNDRRFFVHRQILLIEETLESPADSGAAPLHCPYHSRPLPMQVVGDSESSSGDVIALYACSDPDCRYREAWGTERRSGDLQCLVRGFDQSLR